MTSKPNAKSYSDRAASEPTDLHRNFAEWIEAKTGVKPDLKTVQLAVSLRMDFQASPENQAHLKDRKAAAVAKRKADAAARKAKLEAQLAKIQADLAKETAPVVPAAKKAPAKKAVTATPTQPAKATDKPASAPAKARAPRVRRTAAKAVAPKVTPDVPADFDADDLTDSNNAKPVRRTRRTAAPKA